MLTIDALTIDAEFQGLVYDMTPEEFEALQENIVSEGRVIMPLVVWNHVIVDGHNRYRIIKANPEIIYKVYEKNFADRYEAMAWICKNQLGRRNLNKEQKKYLLGIQYEAEKQSHGGKRDMERNDESGKFTASVQNEHLRQESESTAERIARENNTTASTIRRNAKYAKGVDAGEEAVPGFKKKVLGGGLKTTDAEIASIATTPEPERPALVEKLSAKKKKNEKREDEVARHKIDESSMLETLQYVSDTMISSCERCFEMFPTLLSQPEYRKQVIEILQECKNYILKLEERNEQNKTPL